MAILMLAATRATAQGVAASGPASADTQLVRNQIDSVSRRYVAAFGDGAADEVVALYDSTASELLPRGRNIHGHEALLGYWSHYLRGSGPIGVTLTMAELWLIDDRAYETGKYHAVFKAGTPAEAAYDGNFAMVWRRQADGGWKIAAVFDTPR